MISEEVVQHVEARLRQSDREFVACAEGMGISIYHSEGRPFARLRCLGEAGWEVRCPTKTSWTHIGDFGGEAFEQLDDAIQYITDDPMGMLSGDSN